MRRPRFDSKLETLSEDQKHQLCDWLLSPSQTLRIIKRKVEEEFQVQTSAQALSRFYQAYCGAELLRRRAQTFSVTEQIGQEIARNPGKWDDATIDILKQRCFEIAASRDSRLIDVKHLFSLILKSREQDYRLKKLKAEMPPEESPLSFEEKQQRMKEIFGII